MKSHSNLKSKEDYAAYYEDKVRTCRTVSPNITKRELWLRIIVGITQPGDSAEFKSKVLIKGKAAFDAAWERSDSPETRN